MPEATAETAPSLDLEAIDVSDDAWDDLVKKMLEDELDMLPRMACYPRCLPCSAGC